MTAAQFEAGLRKKFHAFWLALKHHRTHKGDRVDFLRYPYQKKILLDQSQTKVIRKSTQCGISELLLIVALSFAIQKLNCFYLLPNYQLVKRTVDERLRKSVEATAFYKELFRYTKQMDDRDAVNTILSVDIGKGNITCAHSEKGCAQYPADCAIVDEADYIDSKLVKMAPERLSNSDYRHIWYVGNPTFPNQGTDALYSKSNQQKWFVKCPSGHHLTLDWWKHVVREENGLYTLRDTEWKPGDRRDIYPICDVCGKPVDKRQAGEWVATKDHTVSGFQISKLFTTRMTYLEMLVQYEKGLAGDEEEMQRLYNGHLGLAYAAKGAKIDEEMILSCVEGYPMRKEKGLIIAGVDVGKYYHHTIGKMTPSGRFKIIKIGKVKKTEEMQQILIDWNVDVGIIDALPETRASTKICMEHKLFFMCYYTKNNSMKEAAREINQKRTPALDAVKAALLQKTIILPREVKSTQGKEFRDNLTVSVRVLNENRGVYEWVAGGEADHYHHALAYCLMARQLAVLIQKKKRKKRKK
jgi:hypothetical protein